MEESNVYHLCMGEKDGVTQVEGCNSNESGTAAVYILLTGKAEKVFPFEGL